jgi:hypothetical protein
MSSPKFKRQRTVPINTASRSDKWRELNYLKKFIREHPINYLRKYENVPELILRDYNESITHTSHPLGIPLTTEERLSCIKEEVDWHLNLKPAYLKQLKVLGMTSKEFGLMMGYSTPQSFFGSYARIKFIRRTLALLQRHEEALFHWKQGK